MRALRSVDPVRSASLAVLFALGSAPLGAAAQDRGPAPSAASNDGAARPIEPSATPQGFPPAPPGSTLPPASSAGPLPPLPPAGPLLPAESPNIEAPPPPPPPPPQTRPARPWFGGLGYATLGPFFGDLSTLDSALAAPDALGASYGIGSSAITLGGGGGALLFGHLWLGGKGVGLLTAPFENGRGKAMLTGGGGGFELGYVWTSHPRMLIIPYFALGGFAYNLEVTNKSGRAIPMQTVLSLAPGETRSFMAGFATAELGLRLQRLLFSRSGGFTGGFEVGLLRSLTAAPWKSDNAEFPDHKGAIIEGAYARINIGGGGFFFR